jgi:sugar phosphate isomerase/epimerase
LATPTGFVGQYGEFLRNFYVVSHLQGFLSADVERAGPYLARPRTVTEVHDLLSDVADIGHRIGDREYWREERGLLMKLGLSATLAHGATFEEKLQFAERHGFDGVEIILRPPELDPQNLAAMEKALSRSPMVMCCSIVSSALVPVPIETEEVRLQKLAKAKMSIEIAALFGGVALVSPEYRPQDPLPFLNRPVPLSQTEQKLLHSFLSEVAEEAERRSVTVGLEPINRYESRYYHTLEEVIAICDRLGSKRVRLISDFFHMNIEEKDIVASIKKAKGYICHVQLGDSNRELPGLGHIDFASGIQALKGIGYDGFLSLECRIPEDPLDQLPDCVRFLRKLMG